MPICPFFVSGKCTYGTKCYNLHVDIGQVIQTTAKASLGGKQWLLSSFAPFEGETDLPNFIEDQAFEEVRSEFYAARATNTEHLAKQKFNQAWTHAQELTMKMINQDQSVVAYLVDTFGVNGKRKSSSSTTPSNTLNQQPSTFGTPAGTGSLFGTSTNSSFGAPVPSSITGGGGSIFGGQTTAGPAANGGSIFGGTTSSASGGSIFGGSPAVATIPPVGGSIFGQPAAAQQSSGNIFGQTVAAQQSSGNIFGQSQQPGIFGGAAVQQPALPPPTQGGNIFNQNVFGGSAPIQPQQQSQSANMGNIFGQSQQAPTNIFQQQKIPEHPSIFSPQVPQPAAQPPPPNPFQNSSPFASASNQASPAVTGTNVFGNLAQNASQAAQTSIFGTSASQASTGGNAFRGVTDDSYSRAEDLSSEVLDTFKRNEPFELGRIPNVAPPRELCF